jgi:hypothetical protein
MSTREWVLRGGVTTAVLVILEIYRSHDRITVGIWVLVGVILVLWILDFLSERYQVILKSGTGSFRERYELRRRVRESRP